MLRDFQLQDIEQGYQTCKDRELARRLLDHATTAFRVLTDDEERKAYQKSLKARKPSTEVSPRIRAGVEAQKGRLALSAKRYGEAHDLFIAATRLLPDEPSYHFMLGKTLYLQALDQIPADKPIPEGVRKPLLKAQALDTHYDEPRLYLGYLAKRNGEIKRALKEFKAALECNPKNKLAHSEVRLLKRRLGESRRRQERIRACRPPTVCNANAWR